MKSAIGHAMVAVVLFPFASLAESFPELAARCTPTAPLRTIRAVARAESNFDVLALSINQPLQRHLRLQRQPRSKREAIAWTHWLLAHRYSVSIGLMQISSIDAAEHGLTVDEVFDPCSNLRLGWRILVEKYQISSARLGPGQPALLEALSLYNSGSKRIGFVNGYVSRVLEGEFQKPSRTRTHISASNNPQRAP